MIIAVPAATPVIKPVSLTVATASLEDVYVTGVPAGVTETSICDVVLGDNPVKFLELVITKVTSLGVSSPPGVGVGVSPPPGVSSSPAGGVTPPMFDR